MSRTAREPAEARVALPPGFALLIPAILAAMSMLGPFSIDTPFPAFPQMAHDLDVSSAQMQLVISAYLISFGLMSPFWGPLSDALGRRPVMIGGVTAYAVASIGCALAPTLPVLLAFRVLQGLVVGGGVIVSRTIIRDVFEGAQAQRLMSRVMMIFSVAPAIAPIVGGLLLQLGPWELLFWFMACLGAVLVVVVAVALPETHPAERRIRFNLRSLGTNLAGVSKHAEFHRVAWAAALCFAAQFLYIGSAPIFVIDLLGKGELDFWVLFVPMIGGLMLGSQISSWAAGRIETARLVTAAMLFGVTGAIINLFLAVSFGPSLPAAVIGPALIAVGTGTFYPSTQLILLDLFPHGRGAAVSMFTFITLLLNGLLAGALTPLVTGSVAQLASAALALGLGGLLVWGLHLRVDGRQPQT
jgi:DHA1 family bicyclomycin/chloramphenicol resistance-like MFS transporter